MTRTLSRAVCTALVIGTTFTTATAATAGSLPAGPAVLKAVPQAQTAATSTSTLSGSILRFTRTSSPVTAAPGSTITATLTWDGRADLDLGLRGPDGGVLASSATFTAGKETPWLRHQEVVHAVVPAGGVKDLLVTDRWGDTGYGLTVQVAVPQATAPLTPSAHLWGVEHENPGHVYTLAEAQEHARHADLLSAVPYAYRGLVPAMKAVNPRLRVVTYMNGSMAYRTERDSFPSSWYLHDRNGNKIANNWGVWLMDPANASWIANRTQKCLDNMRVEGSDGCFVDNLGTGTIWHTTLTGTPLNPRTGSNYTEAQWITDTAALIGRLHAGLPAQALLFGNGLMDGPTYWRPGAAASRVLMDTLDIGCAETFVRIANTSVTSFRPENQWRADVEMLRDAAARGKTVAALTKVWVPATQAQLDRWHEYALGTFLLGDNGTNFFSFSSGGPTSQKLLGGAWESSLRLGAADGAYAPLPSGGYGRSYANGRVVVNPTGTAVRLTLSGTYVDLGGTPRSGTVTLEPNTAMVLTRA